MGRIVVHDVADRRPDRVSKRTGRTDWVLRDEDGRHSCELLVVGMSLFARGAQAPRVGPGLTICPSAGRHASSSSLGEDRSEIGSATLILPSNVYFPCEKLPFDLQPVDTSD